MKRIITLCAVVTALVVSAGQVQAGHGQNGHHGNSNHYMQSQSNTGFGFVQQHNQWNSHSGNQWNNLWGNQWNNNGHLDFHPAQIVPHRNHFHVNPGHYDFHQSNHSGNHW